MQLGNERNQSDVFSLPGIRCQLFASLPMDFPPGYLQKQKQCQELPTAASGALDLPRRCPQPPLLLTEFIERGQGAGFVFAEGSAQCKPPPTAFQRKTPALCSSHRSVIEGNQPDEDHPREWKE